MTLNGITRFEVETYVSDKFSLTIRNKPEVVRMLLFLKMKIEAAELCCLKISSLNTSVYLGQGSLGFYT